jgi:beta-glucosidase
MRRFFMPLAFCLSWIAMATAQQSPPPYKNPQLAIEDRVADLLSRMTLEEKVEQLCGGYHVGWGIYDPSGKYSTLSVDDLFKQLNANESTLSAHDRAAARNAIQRFAIEKTPLGIPDLFHGEGLHGFMA